MLYLILMGILLTLGITGLIHSKSKKVETVESEPDPGLTDSYPATPGMIGLSKQVESDMFNPSNDLVVYEDSGAKLGECTFCVAVEREVATDFSNIKKEMKKTKKSVKKHGSKSKKSKKLKKTKKKKKIG